MTDYELVSAMTGSLNLVWTIFATYVSIVFAFLVASYLIARKLAVGMVWLVLTLYSVVSLWAMFGLNRTTSTIIGLASEIKRVALEPGSTLGWHTAASTPEIVLSIVVAVNGSVGIIAYIGSIVFFFHRRYSRLTGGTSG